MAEDRVIASLPQTLGQEQTTAPPPAEPVKAPAFFSSFTIPMLGYSLFSPQTEQATELTPLVPPQNTTEQHKTEHKPTDQQAPTVSETKEDTEQKTEQQSWYERIKTAAISSTTGIANATAKIKYAFISKDTEEAFLQIWELMNLLLKDVPFNKLDLLFGLMMLQEYYKAIPVRSHLAVRDQDLVFTARHYLKFACACFGPKYIHGMILKNAGGVLHGMFVGDNANIAALCEYCKINPEDVITSRWTSTSFDPGHYLALDHARGALVLAIRGTFHLKDCLTDLVAHAHEFQDGWVHKGFFKAAERKFELLEATILEYLRHHPLYELVVCGHSMGAGIGAIFTLLFHKAHPEVPIHCYAFGCPCIFSPEIAMAPITSKLITTIVLGDDVVPQLSFESMAKLKHVVVQILSQSNNSLQRAFHWVASNNALSDNTLGRIASILQCTPKPEMLTHVQNVSNLSTSLYPPGNIYHIFKRVETTTTTTTTTSTAHSSAPSTSTSTTSTTTIPPEPSALSSGGSDVAEPISTITETITEVSVNVKTAKPHSSIPQLDIPTIQTTSAYSAPPSPNTSTMEPPTTPSKVPKLQLSPRTTPKTTPTTTPSQSPQVSPRTDSSQTTIKTVQQDKELGYDLERSNPALFHEIFISPSMFLDHMPHFYEHALQVMVDEYNEETKNLKDTMSPPASTTTE